VVGEKIARIKISNTYIDDENSRRKKVVFSNGLVGPMVDFEQKYANIEKCDNEYGRIFVERFYEVNTRMFVGVGDRFCLNANQTDSIDEFVFDEIFLTVESIDGDSGIVKFRIEDWDKWGKCFNVDSFGQYMNNFDIKIDEKTQTNETKIVDGCFELGVGKSILRSDLNVLRNSPYLKVLEIVECE